MEPKRMHRNTKQDDIFISFMSDHPQLAKDFTKGDRVKSDELWRQLTDELNLAGPPVKSVKEWKKIWQGWKTCIRRKLAHNKAEISSTGGGEYNQVILTQNERTVALLSGIFKTIDGIQHTASFGPPPDKSASNITTQVLPNAPLSETTANGPPEDTTQESNALPEQELNVSNNPKYSGHHGVPNKKSFKKQNDVASLVREEINVFAEIEAKLDDFIEIAKNQSVSLQNLCKLLHQANIEARRHNLKMEELQMEQNELR